MASVVDIQHRLFEKLTLGTGILQTSYPNVRVFLTEHEYDLVAHSIKILQTYVFNREVVFLLLESEGNFYLISTGVDNPLPKWDLEAIDNRVEFSLFAIANGPSYKLESVTEEQLLNEVFTDLGVEDVSWEIIEKCFPQILTYEVKIPIDSNEGARRYFLKTIAINALCLNPSIMVLPFNEDTINMYMAIASCGNDEIPVDNILRSLGSNYWKFCYVDVYRCIERLLLIGWVQNYHQIALLKTFKPNDLFTCMNEIFKVEHHEWDNIEYLFGQLPGSITSVLIPVINGEKPFKYIYELRNKIVHFQKDDRDVNAISDENWNIIIQFMLKATIELYNRLDVYVRQLPTL